MKKKYIFLFVCCFVSIMITNMNIDKEDLSLNNILLSNVEALASGESVDDVHKLGCDPVDEDKKCTGNDGVTYTYMETYKQ